MIYINLSEVRSANYRIPSLASKINHMKRAVGLMRYRLPEEIMERYHIREQMDAAYSALSQIETQIDEVYMAVNSCVDQYACAEKENSNNADAFD